MTEIKLTKRYPHSRTEDITDAFMRGYEQGKKDGLNVGKQIVLGAFETYITADRKTEPFDKDINVRSKTEPSFKVDGIGDDDSTIHAIAHLQKVGWLQEHDRALTEPQTEEWHDDCNTCRWHACTIPCCDYEPKTEPQICDTCRYYNSNIPCGSTPSACKKADKFAEEFVDGLKKLKTEPQTDLLVTEYPQDGEVNLIGRDKTEAVVMAYDTYKELTEPQTDCSWK